MSWSSRDFRQAWESRSSLRVFFLATASIFIVGALVAYLIASTVISRDAQTARDQLLSVARIAATAIDVHEHETLVEPGQMDSEAYRRQSRHLNEVLQGLPEIRFVYTVRRVGTEYYFVLDPTPAGDLDRDGVDDKSYLLDPLPVVDREMVEVFETGIPAVTKVPFEDPWGVFITAYAPLRNVEGDVVAVLGVDRDYQDFISASNEVRRAFWASLLLSLAVGILLGGLVARQVGGPRVEEIGPLRRLLIRKVFGLTFAEISLYTLVALTVGTSIITLSDVKAQERSLYTNIASDRALAQGEGLADLGLAGLEPTANQMERRLGALSHAGYAVLARELASALRATAEPGHLARVSRSLHIERTVLENARAEMMREMTSKMGFAFTFAAIAILVSVTGVLMLRHATQQDLVLRQTTQTSQRLQTTYSRLVESLPIGLFAYNGARFEFANAAWRRMIGATDDDTAWDSFLNAMDEHDRGVAESLLLRQAFRREKFLLSVRVLGPAGQWRHLEIHALPVSDQEDALDYMLAFVLDTTETVTAGETLANRNEDLRQALEALEGTLDSTVRLLVRIVEAKDRYTAGHSERVAAYSVAIGRRMGLVDSDLRILELGALIHDVGKIGIPDAVLNKPGGLTDEEFGVVKSHPAIGHLMIRDMQHFAECAPLVLNHHERLDGSGYPNGLAGDQLSLLVRILMVADSFDAMTSTRAYRRGLQARHAILELTREAENGKQDPEVVRCLAENVDRGLPPFDGLHEEPAA